MDRWTDGPIDQPTDKASSRVASLQLKSAFQQISASLCRALASKPFEIEIWDWSRLKENLKIF